MNTVAILVEEQGKAKAGTLGGPSRSSGGKQTVKNVAAEKLRESLTGLSGQISEILQDVKQVGDFKLKQVQVGVEISAEGGFVLIGKAGVKGAVTLTFAAE
ncbi:MAG: hypothetical protein GY862_04855 [Gammaproteobacteria bacterium]|nr:hypothetical protein [Gammaproteobacteria bacterium]